MVVRKSATVRLGTTSTALATSRHETRGRRDGHVGVGRQRRDRRHVVGLRDELDDADDRRGVDRATALLDDNTVDQRRVVLHKRRQRARAERVQVRAARHPLGEVDVAPGRGDVTEERTLGHALALAHRRLYVPVAVGDAGARDRDVRAGHRRRRGRRYRPPPSRPPSRLPPTRRRRSGTTSPRRRRCAGHRRSRARGAAGRRGKPATRSSWRHLAGWTRRRRRASRGAHVTDGTWAARPACCPRPGAPGRSADGKVAGQGASRGVTGDDQLDRPIDRQPARRRQAGVPDRSLGSAAVCGHGAQQRPERLGRDRQCRRQLRSQLHRLDAGRGRRADAGRSAQELDAAPPHGLQLWLGLAGVDNDLGQQPLLDTDRRTRSRAIPALGAWKGADEPAHGHVPAAGCVAVYEHLQHRSIPNHPVVIIEAPRGPGPTPGSPTRR